MTAPPPADTPPTRPTHAKKRVEIIVEASLMRPAIDLIDRVGATGWTVFDGLAGRGNDGRWDRGPGSDAFRRVMIVVICAPDLADRLVDEAFALLNRYSAIVTVSDVAVVRGDRF